MMLPTSYNFGTPANSHPQKCTFLCESTNPSPSHDYHDDHHQSACTSYSTGSSNVSSSIPDEQSIYPPNVSKLPSESMEAEATNNLRNFIARNSAPSLSLKLPISSNSARKSTRDSTSTNIKTQSSPSLTETSSNDSEGRQSEKQGHENQESSYTHHYQLSSLPLVYECTQLLCNPLRTIVSQNRRRFQLDGFNLDLTYITDRIIAMGYPADTKEALYRNSMSHIVKFLEHYHPGHYKVFNLRGQYVYDTSKFHNRVMSFEMTDHHPPRLELMAPFCREVHEYLQADPLNVVAVHCKAGKGRTGVMICAYLCYISFYKTPQQNMDYYSIIRTRNNKGVTIPSQRRYVYYFSHLREKKLNYMPLLCELVGIYLERIPKLSGTFSRGALKVRVALGDVEVFLGDDLSLDSDESDNEEEMRANYLQMKGDDHYNHYKPEEGKDCISRRCYGWTVPSDQRVFLQGDIRVDIFQKSRIKLLNVKQERKKIGHIWFNTMFTCPGFSGDQYVHGDEAYSDNTDRQGPSIIRKKLRRKSKNDDLDHGHGIQRINQNQMDEPCSKIHREGIRKRNSKSPSRQQLEDKQKSRIVVSSHASQDRDNLNTIRGSTNKGRIRTSLDTENEYEEEIVVETPPGLESHCSGDTLREIFGKQTPPRCVNKEIIIDAYRKNLINEFNRYENHVPENSLLMPKSPAGRPRADGPFCLMRQKEEHVCTFGIKEIDRANKNKDLDAGFKVIIVTKCINAANENDLKIAQDYVQIIGQKQANKERAKREKLEMRQKKLMSHNQQNEGDANSSDCQSQYITDSSSASSQSQLSASIPDLSFKDDPRMDDPHLKKFFFRQRITSQSRHPNIHYHCPMLQQDPNICLKYSCNKRRTRGSINTNAQHIDVKTRFYADDDADIENDAENEDSFSFSDFDFFKPSSLSLNNRKWHNTTDENITHEHNWTPEHFPERSVTLTSKNVDEQYTEGLNENFEWVTEKMKSHRKGNSPKLKLEEDDSYNVSDCSWAQTSSSSESS